MTTVTATTSRPASLALGTDLSPMAIGYLFAQAGAAQVASIKYLIECGRRLKEKRDSLPGQWLMWLETNRETLGFGERTSQKLIAATSKVDPTLTADLSPEEALRINRAIWGNSNRQPRVAHESSQKASIVEPRVPPTDSPVLPEASDTDEPERPDMEALDREAAESFERERQASIDRWLVADDKLAAAQLQIDQLTQRIVGLNVTLAGERNTTQVAIRAKKEADRQIAAMERKLAKADDEIHDLRERVAQMEGA